MISVPQDDNHATLKEKGKFCQKEFLLQDLRNHVDMCLRAISDYCDYDRSTSSSDDLPEVQIQIGLGKEQSILQNAQKRSPNSTLPSCNDRNNASDDVALVDASFNNGHDTLPQDTNNINASYNDDDSNKIWLFLIAILQVMTQTKLLLLLIVITVMLHNKTWI